MQRRCGHAVRPAHMRPARPALWRPLHVCRDPPSHGRTVRPCVTPYPLRGADQRGGSPCANHDRRPGRAIRVTPTLCAVATGCRLVRDDHHAPHDVPAREAHCVSARRSVLFGRYAGTLVLCVGRAHTRTRCLGAAHLTRRVIWSCAGRAIHSASSRTERARPGAGLRMARVPAGAAARHRWGARTHVRTATLARIRAATVTGCGPGVCCPRIASARPYRPPGERPAHARR